MSDAVLTLKDGRSIRQVDEEELDGDLFFRFQRISVKFGKEKIDESIKWLVMQLFTIDGDPLTVDHLTEKPSAGGLGFRVVAQLCKIASEFVEGLPNPKTASTSADSPDGDLLN